MTDTTHENLMKIGKNALDAIRDMTAALECDYDRLEELREERDNYEPSDGEERLEQTECKTLAEQWEFDNSEDAAELKELEEVAGECTSRDDAKERIHEDPLSIQVRGGWRDLGAQDDGAEEFCILLTTGGPAVRIMGELSDGEPTRAYLQVQDWGTAWTDYYEQGIGEVLMTYVRCFCFEER
jgi:hypothetical protein